MAERSSVSEDAIVDLVKLSDLSRVCGIGPIFARIFLDSGIDIVEKLAKGNAEKLFKRLEDINREKGYTKTHFTVKDVQYCINMAEDLPKAIEY